MHMPPYVIQVKKLWGTTNGFAFWPFILVLDESNRTVIEHEKIHIKQQLRGLLIGFYIKYLYYHYTVGYEENPYEKEAYAHQDDWKDEHEDINQT